ncbi:MAG: hypothetical protein V1720_15930 [bacterium]
MKQLNCLFHLFTVLLTSSLSAQSFNAGNIPSMSNTYFRDSRFIFFVDVGFAPIKAGLGLGANIKGTTEVYFQINQFYVPMIVSCQSVGLGGKIFFGHTNSLYGNADLAGIIGESGKWGFLYQIGLGLVNGQCGILSIRTQLRLTAFINSFKAPEYYPGLDISFCLIQAD